MSLIVLSGINLFQGGTLSIYTDCLDNLVENQYYEKNEIIGFVHSKKDFVKYEPYVKIIELPKSRNNYLYRLFYEYVYFYFFSLQNKVDFWISLHDITPNVKAKKRYTYCHNPTPFMENPKSIKKFSKTNYYMAKFYKYLYGINIKRNNAVIVQQSWIKEKFIDMYRIKNVIVATPTLPKGLFYKNEGRGRIKSNKVFTFIYAAYPRAFKNFEIICEAAQKLEEEGIEFRVTFTIDGKENEYSKYLFQKYQNIKAIEWKGCLTREEVFELYINSDCMIFPSRLETWGLPITEYKETGKPLLVADLPYAHETVGRYDKVSFFQYNSKVQLANKMRAVIENKLTYDDNEECFLNTPDATNWKELFDIIGLDS